MPVIDVYVKPSAKDDRQTQSLPRSAIRNRNDEGSSKESPLSRTVNRGGSHNQLPSGTDEVTFMETSPPAVMGPQIHISQASAGTSNVTAGATLITGPSPTPSRHPSAGFASGLVQLDQETLALFRQYPLILASNNRNIDFHLMFRSVPDYDRLVEDFACAYQQDILLQGRMFISRDHICFNSNIFGWVTNLVISFADIVSIERKMTALIIPNAILVSTTGSKYFFASFMYREQAFSILWRLWKSARGEFALDIPIHGGSVAFDDDADEDVDTEPANSSSSGIITDVEDSVSEIENDIVSAVLDSVGVVSLRRPLKHSESKGEVQFTRSLSPQRLMVRPASAHEEIRSGPVSDSEFVNKRRFSLSKDLFQRRMSSAETVGSSSNDLKSGIFISDERPGLKRPHSARSGRKDRTESLKKKPSSASMTRKSSKTQMSCTCGDHCKSIVIDKVFSISAEELVTKVFQEDTFMNGIYQSSGCENVRSTAWKKVDGIERRKLTFDFPLKVAFAPRTTPALAVQKYARKDISRCYCVRESITVPQAAYGTAFVHRSSICVTRVSKRSCRVLIAFELEFTKTSWLKGSLEKSLLDHFISFWHLFETRLNSEINAQTQAITAQPSEDLKCAQENASITPLHKAISQDSMSFFHSAWDFIEPLIELVKDHLYSLVLPALIIIMFIWNMYTYLHVRDLERKLADFDSYIASIDSPQTVPISFPDWWFQPITSPREHIPEDEMTQEYFEEAIQQMDRDLLKHYEGILNNYASVQQEYLNLQKQHMQVKFDHLHDPMV